ncbi:TolC family protein [Lutibacter citreus]|uniref:TolC family protein n=1 Tax=Lutibacter citreus TaxID=2138210 RepID=UPI000DBEA893|nr:TolC family protein [Lutibacter citreus]
MQQLKYILVLLFSSSSLFGYSQNSRILTKENAVSQVLENNFGIKMANNNVNIAKNNASIYNSGYLPTVSANGGVNYTNKDTENTLQDNTILEIDGAESTIYNASLGLNYTLFDGFGRKYTYQKLKQSHNLSELEAQAVIENSLLQLFSLYYEVAQLTENNANIAESLTISKNRLKRAQYSYEYGQSTKLQVLNAEVDVNNDSVSFINTERLLANSKRNLNLLLGRNVNIDFDVDTKVNFELSFILETLLEKAKQHNIEMQKVNKNIELSDFDIKINKSDFLPNLSVNGSYSYTDSENDAAFNFRQQISNGFNAGLNLSWNIFDGGTTKTRVQNAKIYADNLKVQKEQITNELERTVSNSLEIYNNSLFILSTEEKNLATNERNFNRTEELFKLGQVTSIEYRQAQVNLLNAKSSLNTAKYNAKNAELQLLQLTGDLLNTKF